MRKIIQISSTHIQGEFRTTTALCDDGSVWLIEDEKAWNAKPEWHRIPDVPQDDVILEDES